MNTDLEREVVHTIEDLIQKNNFAQICFEAGKFIETAASEIYLDINQSNPKNAKIAIDFLIERKLISRPLGYKLHVVREMRNAQAHNLPYSITSADARLAIDTLNQTIEWLHQGNLVREWQEVMELFHEGETQLEDSSDFDHKATFHTVLTIHRALERATELKLRSLNVEAERMTFFSSVELLAQHNIHVKSADWRDFVHLRNRLAHSSSAETPSAQEAYKALKASLPKLREILEKLNPLDEQSQKVDYPQISSL